MDCYEKARRVIDQLIINKGIKRFYIFPFGMMGIMVKNILNLQFGIDEEGIIDNKLCSRNDKIISLDKLKDHNLDDCMILLSSIDENVYSELRYELMKYVSIDKFVDVFSVSMFFDQNVYYEKPVYKNPRLIALEACAKEIYKNCVRGDIAECGVYQGNFANHMTRLFPE